MTRWALLLFLTLGMTGMYQVEDARVVEVRNGLVTMEIGDCEYQIEEAEAWRAGDRAECVTGRQGIIEARYKK